MKHTSKKKITRAEYIQLVGLLTMADDYIEKLTDLENVIRRIVGEKEDNGHSADAIYSRYTADQLLNILDIKVVDKP